MQCSRTFLFQMCLSLLVSMGSCRCKPLNQIVRDEDLERYYSHFTGQDMVMEDEEEVDADSRLESLMGKMKEEFLRKLNLPEAPQEHSRVYPPQFMMELYNKYASDTSTAPRSDVIRSFTLQGVSHSERNGTGSKHRLLFNVTVPHHEEVTLAEIRLFTQLEGRSTTSEVRATIQVYEVDYTGSIPTQLLLDGREVRGSHPSWEAFDVTHAMQGWVKSSRGGVGGGVSEFEVVVYRWNGGGPFKDRGGGSVGLDVCVTVGGNASAALIIFSDDTGSKVEEAKKELKDMILHEEETVLSSVTSPQDWNNDNNMNHINNNNNSNSSSTANPSNNTNNNANTINNNSNVNNPTDTHPQKRRSRRRRQTESNYCRRTSMRVSFKEIGWDKWIVAPPDYDAFECRGVCLYPLTDDMTPSKHALIQTLVNLRNPKTANMACCVPTKLDPITVMYLENGVITVRHMYEEMKVAECGCR